LTLCGLKKPDFDPPRRVDGDKMVSGVLFLLHLCQPEVAQVD
jgi:hypothetical protein